MWITRLLPGVYLATGHYNVKGSNLDLPIMHLWQYYLVGKIQALYLASALGLYLAPDTVCTVLLYPVLYIPGTRALYLASWLCSCTAYTWHKSTVARGETESALGFMMEMAHICISSAAPPGRRGNCAIHYPHNNDEEDGAGNEVDAWNRTWRPPV